MSMGVICRKDAKPEATLCKVVADSVRLKEMLSLKRKSSNERGKWTYL